MARTDNVLPIFENKQLRFEFRSSRKAHEWDEGVQKIFAYLLLLPVVIVLALVVSFFTNLIPGANDFLNEQKWASMLILIPLLIVAGVIISPIAKRIEERKSDSVWEARQADSKRLVAVIREHGFSVPNGTLAKDISYATYTDLETGIAYRSAAGSATRDGYSMVLVTD